MKLKIETKSWSDPSVCGAKTWEQSAQTHLLLSRLHIVSNYRYLTSLRGEYNVDGQVRPLHKYTFPVLPPLVTFPFGRAPEGNMKYPLLLLKTQRAACLFLGPGGEECARPPLLPARCCRWLPRGSRALLCRFRPAFPPLTPPPARAVLHLVNSTLVLNPYLCEGERGLSQVHHGAGALVAVWWSSVGVSRVRHGDDEEACRWAVRR